MTGQVLLDALVGLGGFAGLGTLVASLASWRKAAKAARELSPNHGSSAVDALRRIEEKQELQNSKIDSLGHQMGELRRDHSGLRETVDAALLLRREG